MSASSSRRGFSVPPPLTSLPGRDVPLGVRKSRRDRGQETGLENESTTCYLNAVVQALLAQRSFVTDLLQSASILRGDVTPGQRARTEAEERAADEVRRRARGEINGGAAAAISESLPAVPHRLSGTFYQSLMTLLRDMRSSSHGLLDAKQLKKLIGERYEQYAAESQQDAHEFLAHCLTSLDDDITNVLRPKAETNGHANAASSSSSAAGSAADSPASSTSPFAASSRKRAAASASASSASIAAASSPALPAPTAAASPPAVWSLLSPSSLQLQVDTLSPIYKNFHCEIEQRLECVSCAYTRVKSEHYNELSLDLPQKPVPGGGNDRSASPASSVSGRSSQRPLQHVSNRLLSSSPPEDPPVSPGDNSLKSEMSSPSSSPLPPPECPVHKRTMLQVISEDAETSSVQQWKCPTLRCKEVRSVATSHADARGSVSLSNMRASTSNSSLSSVGKPASSASAVAAKPASGPSKGGYVASLSELLTSFFSPQVTEYRCERCAGQSVRSTFSFVQLPRVLILHLKRFTPDVRTGSYVKRLDRIRMDDRIDLGFACTQQTRKPLPMQADAEATSAAAGSMGDSFASLFASSAIAACKCGAGADACRHAQGVLTSPADIAAFIDSQHANGGAVAAAKAVAASSARAGSKRKSGDLGSASGAEDASTSERKKAKSGGAGAPGLRFPTDSASYFSIIGGHGSGSGSGGGRDGHSHAAAQAQHLSADINSLQADIRRLQQQIYVQTNSASPATVVQAPIVRKKKEAALQEMVLRLSSMEASLQEKTHAQRHMQAQANKLAANRVRSAAAAISDEGEGWGEERKHNASSSSARSSPASSASSCSSSSSSPAAAAGTASSSNGRSASPPLLAPLGPSIVPLYELQAVVHHKGLIATSGHYNTDIRSSALDCSSRTGDAAAGGCENEPPVWKRYDDQFVKVVDEAQVASLGETNGYLYFFTYSPLLNLEHTAAQQQQALAAAASTDAHMAAASSSARPSNGRHTPSLPL